MAEAAVLRQRHKTTHEKGNIAASTASVTDHSDTEEPVVEPATVNLQKSVTKNATNSRRFGLYFLAIFSLLLMLYTMQRNGWLRHGPSFYLPHSSQSSHYKQSLAFRNIFYHHARAASIRQSDIEKMIFPTDKTLDHVSSSLVPGNENDDVDGLTSLLQAEAIVNEALSPSRLYELGESTPFVSQNPHKRRNNSSPSNYNESNLPTLILFPGILSEFANAKVQMYEDLFLNATVENNVLMREWHNALSSLVKNSKLRSDRVYSLEKLERVTRPLNEFFDVIRVSSLPADEAISSGDYNLIRIRCLPGSLESIGSLARSSLPILRRLDKLFQILPLTGPIHFVGYSRGANVALNVLTLATDRLDWHPWASRIKTLVSVAGALYGTPAADTLFDIPNHAHREVMDHVSNFSAQLNYNYVGDLGAVGHALEIASNTKLFIDTVVSLAEIGSKIKTDARLEQEFGSYNPDFHPWNVATMLRQLFLDNFHMHEPVDGYYENVKRSKIFISALRDALDGITTRTRAEWWSTNVIPTTNSNGKIISYIAIAATMTDSIDGDEDLDLREIMERDVCFDKSSMDFQTSRSFYYDLLNVSNATLNDGQMMVTRSIFWPSITFNKKQKPYEAIAVGVLGTHHWGLAMPTVFDKDYNKFPRDVLMHSIATYVSSEEEPSQSTTFKA